jgi:hypothetical protein
MSPRAFARHELHAQAHTAAVSFGAEHLDDIGVLHLGERPAFAQKALLQAVVRDVLVQNLDRDVPLQLRVPRAIDAAEAAFAEPADQPVLAPALDPYRGGTGWRLLGQFARIRFDPVVVRRSVHVGDLPEHLEPLQPVALVLGPGQAVEHLPVHGRAVGDAVDGPRQDVVRRHGASPERGA